nr:TIM barrel protein [Propionicimonas sp.]
MDDVVTDDPSAEILSTAATGVRAEFLEAPGSLAGRLRGARWALASRDTTSAGGVGLPAMVAQLDEAASLGASALLLGSVREASPTLDDGELADVRAEAERRQVAVEAGFGPVHPGRLDRSEAASLLRAGETLGIQAFHVVFGLMEDRFTKDPSWSETLAGAVPGLRELFDRMPAVPVFRTHEEMTTFELVKLIEDIGNPDVRVGYSPVNVVTRLEDPWAAFQRVRSLIRTVFIDDTWIVRTPRGLARRLCRMGEGSVPWEAIISSLAQDPETVYTVDIHRAEFDMPLFDEEWLAHQPDLTVAELVSLYRCSRADGEQQDSEVRIDCAKALLSSGTHAS